MGNKDNKKLQNQTVITQYDPFIYTHILPLPAGEKKAPGGEKLQ